MTDSSARYALPFLQAGQSQKEVTHNEAIERIDALMQSAVVSRSVDIPPAMPATGSSWIIAAGASGAWADHVNAIGTASDTGWVFIAPRDGCLAWVADENVFAVFYANAWHSDGWPVAGLRIGTRQLLGATVSAINAPVGGALVDSEARTVIDAVLLALRQLGLIAS